MNKFLLTIHYECGTHSESSLRPLWNITDEKASGPLLGAVKGSEILFRWLLVIVYNPNQRDFFSVGSLSLLAMQVFIEKRSKRRVPKVKRRFDVTVIFPRDSDPNIFTMFVVDKNYELLEFLGDRSSRLVCPTMDTSNNEMVAIKKIDSILKNEA